MSYLLNNVCTVQQRYQLLLVQASVLMDSRGELYSCSCPIQSKEWFTAVERFKARKTISVCIADLF